MTRLLSHLGTSTMLSRVQPEPSAVVPFSVLFLFFVFVGAFMRPQSQRSYLCYLMLSSDIKVYKLGCETRKKRIKMDGKRSEKVLRLSLIVSQACAQGRSAWSFLQFLANDKIKNFFEEAYRDIKGKHKDKLKR